MSNRINKVYTRTGDSGETGLANNTRVGKDDLRIETLGDLDELNSAIGLVASNPLLPETLLRHLKHIQHDLFDIGAEIATPSHTSTNDDYVTALEKMIDELNAKLPPLTEFILPGGHPSAAQCHLARCICRRCERNILRLSRQQDVNIETYKYINRLSDLLFVLARTINNEFGNHETYWQSEFSRIKPNQADK